MKIGIICYPTYGGSGVVASELGKNLASLGYEIHIISYKVPFRIENEFLDKIYFHEVKMFDYPLFENPPYTVAISTTITEVIKQYDLDILHAHYAVPHTMAAYLAKKMARKDDLKIITTLHGTDITLVGKDPAYFSAVKFSIEESDAVTAVSDWLKNETIKLFKVNKDIRTIYNFVDTDKFKKNLSEKCREKIAKTDEKIVMHISNFRPVKRVQDVIYTFSEIIKHIPAKLVMVGDGPDRSLAFSLTTDLNIQDKVLFLGKQVNIECVLPFADLLLLPSNFESFGLVALEAMACEVPVIGTNGGGLPEVVIEGENGYLCNVGDYCEMAEKAVALLGNDDLYKKMSKKSRERAIEVFNQNKIVKQYMNLYNEVLAKY